jgi:hypothetical protein
MYTTHDNLEHTIKLQEELFRQHLRLRGINLNKDNDDTSSEHFYDNIDSETSDIEKQTREYQNRYQKTKQQRTVRFSDEQQKAKTISKRKNIKSLSKLNLTKLPNNKKYNYQNSNMTNNKFLLSNMLTVTIT